MMVCTKWLGVLLLALGFSFANSSSCSRVSINVTVVPGSGENSDVYWQVQKRGESEIISYGSVGSTAICLGGTEAIDETRKGLRHDGRLMGFPGHQSEIYVSLSCLP